MNNAPAINVAPELAHPLPKWFAMLHTRMVTVHGKCRRCGAGVRRAAVIAGKALWRVNGTDHDGTEECACGARVRVQQLVARVVADVKCNAICTSAKGHSCDCSCGGANHGSDHAHV